MALDSGNSGFDICLVGGATGGEMLARADNVSLLSSHESGYGPENYGNDKDGGSYHHSDFVVGGVDQGPNDEGRWEVADEMGQEHRDPHRLRFQSGGDRVHDGDVDRGSDRKEKQSSDGEKDEEYENVGRENCWKGEEHSTEDEHA